MYKQRSNTDIYLAYVYYKGYMARHYPDDVILTFNTYRTYELLYL